MVSIIAALVGVAVPFFQDYVRQSQETKLAQELDQLADAIRRYEIQTRSLLTGSKLEPLVGITLQELTRDPWGNPWVYDGALGVVGSMGGNGIFGGEGVDADRWKVLKRELRIVSATIAKGGLGFPQAGDLIEIQLNKPFRPLQPDGAGIAQDIVFWPGDSDAFALPLWWQGYRYDAARSNPPAGKISLRCNIPAPPGSAPGFTNTTRIAFGGVVGSVLETWMPYEETGIEDPFFFTYGVASPVLPDGSLDGVPLSR